MAVQKVASEGRFAVQICCESTWQHKMFNCENKSLLNTYLAAY